MFSVVIPLYNKEDSIFQTVQSVLQQTFQDFEIIIVNDGSTDDSLNIISEIEDSRISIISKINEGVSIARNTGIQNAKKEWICFLDADDNWENNKLELYNDFINRNRMVEWLFSAYYIKDSEYTKVVRYAETKVLSDVLVGIKDGLRIQTSSVAIKRSVFDDKLFLFTPFINNSEDRELWYKLSCLKPVAGYLGVPLSTYSIGVANSLTANIRNHKGVAYHFLSMNERLQGLSENLSKERAYLLSSVIEQFNKAAIVRIWVRNNGFTANDFSEKIEPKLLVFLKTTYKLPTLVKKVFAKYLI